MNEDQISKTNPIASAIALTTDELGALHKAVALLADKIAPILSTDPAIVATEYDSKKRQSVCEIESHIRNIGDMVVNEIKFVQEITSRICL